MNPITSFFGISVVIHILIVVFGKLNDGRKWVVASVFNTKKS